MGKENKKSVKEEKNNSVIDDAEYIDWLDKIKGTSVGCSAALMQEETVTTQSCGNVATDMDQHYEFICLAENLGRIHFQLANFFIQEEDIDKKGYKCVTNKDDTGYQFGVIINNGCKLFCIDNNNPTKDKQKVLKRN